MGRRRRFSRDQAQTPFCAILERFCASAAMVAAALVDQDGETVDYAGALDPFDVRIFAAEWRIVLELSTAARPGCSEVFIRAAKSSYVIVSLSEGYALVARLLRHSFTISPRAVAQCVRELCEESGLDLPRPARPGAERWTAVRVNTLPDDRHRPFALWTGDRWSRVEILGRFAGDDLAPGEQAYRVRTFSGMDLTLVRERLGHWFADDMPA